MSNVNIVNIMNINSKFWQRRCRVMTSVTRSSTRQETSMDTVVSIHRPTPTISVLRSKSWLLQIFANKNLWCKQFKINWKSTIIITKKHKFDQTFQSCSSPLSDCVAQLILQNKFCSIEHISPVFLVFFIWYKIKLGIHHIDALLSLK